MWPAGIVTLVGTLAAGLSLDREMTSPPAGAVIGTTTVPVEGLPPTTEAGFKVMELSVMFEIATGLERLPVASKATT